jgi:hypothetical protein
MEDVTSASTSSSTGIPAQRPPATCSACGAQSAETPPISWSVSVEGGKRLWTCDRCAREHVRSIEAKLESAWW